MNMIHKKHISVFYVSYIAFLEQSFWPRYCLCCRLYRRTASWHRFPIHCSDSTITVAATILLMYLLLFLAGDIAISKIKGLPKCLPFWDSFCNWYSRFFTRNYAYVRRSIESNSDCPNIFRACGRTHHFICDGICRTSEHLKKATGRRNVLVRGNRKDIQKCFRIWFNIIGIKNMTLCKIFQGKRTKTKSVRCCKTENML